MARAVPYLFPHGAQIGHDNLVLHATAKRHRVESFAGPLSIKTVLAGRVAWIVEGRELVVSRSSFLVLSPGQTYSIDIASPTPVETCCVFFAPGFVESIAHDATTPLLVALDHPARQAPPLPGLPALQDDRDRRIVPHVHTLAPRCAAIPAPSGFEEDFLLLANALLEFYGQIQEQAARVPAAKQSTRDELFRRLLLGRDFIHAHLSEPVSLATVSRAACLSPFHFHRGFTHAFQQTPHAYLTSLRMEHARRTLQSGASALEACLDAGFSSPSAFSRAFRSQFAESPSAVRRKFARSGKNRESNSAKLGP